MPQTKKYKRIINLILISLLLWLPQQNLLAQKTQVTSPSSNLGQTKQTKASTSPQPVVDFNDPAFAASNMPTMFGEKKDIGKLKKVKKPPAFLNYLLMMVIAVLSISFPAYSKKQGIAGKGENLWTPLSMWTLLAGSTVYIAQEIMGLITYKKASQKTLHINEAGNYDQQRDKFLKAAKITEEAAKAATFKYKIQKVAAMTIKASVLMAMWELLFKYLEQGIALSMPAVCNLTAIAHQANQVAAYPASMATASAYYSAVSLLAITSTTCLVTYLSGFYFSHKAPDCFTCMSQPHVDLKSKYPDLLAYAGIHSHYKVTNHPKSPFVVQNETPFDRFLKKSTFPLLAFTLDHIFKLHILSEAHAKGDKGSEFSKGLGLIGIVVATAGILWRGGGWYVMTFMKIPETRAVAMGAVGLLLNGIMKKTQGAAKALTHNARKYQEAADEVARLKGLKKKKDQEAEEKRKKLADLRNQRLNQLESELNRNFQDGSGKIPLPDPSCISGTGLNMQADPDCNCKKSNTCFKNDTLDNPQIKKGFASLPVPSSIRTIGREANAISASLSKGNFSKASSQSDAVNKKFGVIHKLTHKFKGELNRRLKKQGKPSLKLKTASTNILSDSLKKAQTESHNAGMKLSGSVSVPQNTNFFSNAVPSPENETITSESQVTYTDQKQQLGSQTSRSQVSTAPGVKSGKLDLTFEDENTDDLFENAENGLNIDEKKLKDVDKEDHSLIKNQINKSDDEALFENITGRYFRNAYPVFFKNKRKP